MFLNLPHFVSQSSERACGIHSSPMRLGANQVQQQVPDTITFGACAAWPWNQTLTRCAVSPFWVPRVTQSVENDGWWVSRIRGKTLCIGGLFFSAFFFGFWLLAFGFWLLRFLASGLYLLHFGAQISDLRAICCSLEPICMLIWLLAFGFWLLARSVSGFWSLICLLFAAVLHAHLAFGFWLLARSVSGFWAFLIVYCVWADTV